MSEKVRSLANSIFRLVLINEGWSVESASEFEITVNEFESSAGGAFIYVSPVHGEFPSQMIRKKGLGLSIDLHDKLNDVLCGCLVVVESRRDGDIEVFPQGNQIFDLNSCVVVNEETQT